MNQDQVKYRQLKQRIKELETENSILKSENEKKNLHSTKGILPNEDSQKWQPHDLFNYLLDEIHIWELVKDKKGNIKTWKLLDANPPTLKAWRKKRKDIIGKTARQIFNYEAETLFLPIVKKIFKTGKPYSWETYFPPTNQYLSMRSIPFTDYFISTGRDISEHKKIEHDIIENQKEFQTWIQNTPVCTKKIDLDFNLQFMSEAGIKELKVDDINQLYGAPYPFNFFPKEFQKTMKTTMEKVKSSGEIMQIDGILSDTKGNRMWYNHILIPVKDDTGKPDYLLIISTDISARKHAEQELIKAKERAEESEQRLKLASESAQLGIWDLNIPENILLWDDRMYELYGVKKNSRVKTIDTWINGIHPEDKEYALSEFHEALKGNKQFNTNFRVKHPNGNIIYIKGDGLVIRDSKGKAIRMIGINRDVTESKLNENELKIAKDKAEESDRLKTEFINNMSHEIRTPMNGIIGFTEMLEKDDLSAEKRKYYSKIVQNSSYQLLRIIDDIIEISSLGTKQEKLHESEFNLNDMFMELFSVFNLKSRERNIPIYVKKALHDDKSYITTDKSKLNKILSNLLENAIKYTNEGFIELGYYLEKQNLVMYVKDTGIGIDPKNHALVFDRFSQENKDISRRFGGLGLGLSISKENAQLLGGDILIDSEKGKGSTFYLTIPYIPGKTASHSTAAESAVPFDNESDKYTILVAEDEEVNYLYLEAIFENGMPEKYSLLHAKNGKEAVEICTTNGTVDLILMDIKMPVMDGYDACRIIKSKFPNVPVIAQTAYSTESEKEIALKNGFNDFIAKPKKKDKLIELISKYLPQ